MNDSYIGGVIYAVLSVVLILFFLDMFGIYRPHCWFWQEGRVSLGLWRR